MHRFTNVTVGVASTFRCTVIEFCTVLPIYLHRAIMTSERKAKSLINYYTSVGAFSWITHSRDARGITITFILGLPPLRDIWHYIGVVLEERKEQGINAFITDK